MPRASKAAISKSYVENGVAISPTIPTTGENVKIKYDGLLAKSGAEQVYAHVGFGNAWSNVQDYPMTRTSTGFETSVLVLKGSTLNVAFKDSANNWDNNCGENYVFEIL